MLFFTYLLSPSLDIVVEVALSSTHLVEDSHISHEEMYWSFIGCRVALHLL